MVASSRWASVVSSLAHSSVTTGWSLSGALRMNRASRALRVRSSKVSAATSAMSPRASRISRGQPIRPNFPASLPSTSMAWLWVSSYWAANWPSWNARWGATWPARTVSHSTG